MEILILDALLRPIDLIDQFISFVWAERYSEKGDFDLVTLSTPANRRRFVEDTLVSIVGSKRIMRVDRVEETIDEDEGKILKIKGYELSAIFEQRVIAVKEDAGEFAGMIRPVNYYNGLPPHQIPNFMVWQMCFPSGYQLSLGDTIPLLQSSYPGSGEDIYPPGNLPLKQPLGILWEQKVDKLYSAITDVCKSYDLGFRLFKDPNASKLYFQTYVGNDRTSAQTIFPPVVFSSDMRNLQNTTEYMDATTHFNVVLAMYQFKNPTEGGYPENLSYSAIASDPQLAFSSGGFDQKTKQITLTQIPETLDPEDIPAYLQQVAEEELTRSRTSVVFDGEIDQNSDFVYERDYFLGDLVEVRGNNGGAAYMRVEEQIIKADASGESSYPSLVTKDSISPGTWRSWKYDVDWVDMGSGEYWSNQ